MSNIHDFSAHFPKVVLFNDDANVNRGYEEFKRLFLKENIEAEYQIWEFKVDSKQYLLSIRDKEVNLHSHSPIEKMEGEGSTREIALKYFLEKYGEEFLKSNKKLAVCSYSCFRKGNSKSNPLVINYHSVQKLFTKVNVKNIVLDKSSEMPVINGLEPKQRSREYQLYDNYIRDKIVYEYLFHSRTHRWLDKHVIRLNSHESRGYQSMGILHFIGLKDKHKGIFMDINIDQAINLLEQQDSDFSLVIQCLYRLSEVIVNDIDSEKAEEDSYYKDGAVKEYYGKRYERNPENRKKAIEIHGLSCVVCGFNFEKVYGERGKDFIEVHHVKPLSSIGEEVAIDPEEDLVPICSNCHRMIHRQKDKVLTVEELRFLISQQK